MNVLISLSSKKWSITSISSGAPWSIFAPQELQKVEPRGGMAEQDLHGVVNPFPQLLQNWLPGGGVAPHGHAGTFTCGLCTGAGLIGAGFGAGFGAEKRCISGAPLFGLGGIAGGVPVVVEDLGDEWPWLQLGLDGGTK